MEQIEIILPRFERGCHLITNLIEQYLPALPQTGLLNLFIQHTSCGITINENADPTVRHDLEQALNRIIPEDTTYYTHTLEGKDDMPAHIKNSLIGCSLTIPIRHGRLALGTWQGIYLCEFRNAGGHRHIIATIYI
ncbi:secondary thiamine-phosphate synthase enzyme YjbQ [Coprobacter tertius]|uniref:Secondary thiamine-phosphate synthase enzyme YjbQ n=1 Tax=Coprobacter tertius TaxID=2944915 RepID=A0ABT1MLA9_9BACT|nr:secondary thiamine-phosphate synthase enzyme YjbQ [Coprobacter tertius]MCP9612671.1 secondary thiamine-phosphate synthase enzyme YjbQ [Coprobacter tertius]